MAFSECFNDIQRLTANGKINTAPIIKANLIADKSDDVWTLPIGLGIGKTFRLGKLPMNTRIGYYKNVITPDNGADSQLRLQIQAMFPKQARLKNLMLQVVK